MLESWRDSACLHGKVVSSRERGDMLAGVLESVLVVV